MELASDANSTDHTDETYFFEIKLLQVNHSVSLVIHNLQSDASGVTYVHRTFQLDLQAGPIKDAWIRMGKDLAVLNVFQVDETRITIRDFWIAQANMGNRVYTPEPARHFLLSNYDSHYTVLKVKKLGDWL